ncbi:DUF2273 domain-containing protein [Paenibacillus sp. 1P07SE]|uniref:DUF2273 domain-containing protein n=1 Tax=Paenibacillus sp. 1P07SE TaxID=3132209 RepID=UPI0039A642A9
MWREYWLQYRGRIAGMAIAVFLGMIYLVAGFWDMLFVALLLWIGYYFGKQKDEAAPPMIPWGRITDWLTDRWRWFK